MMSVDMKIRNEFEAVVQEAYLISGDMGKEIEGILHVGREHPLDQEEATRLLTKSVEILRSGAEKRGDREAVKALTGKVEDIVSQIITMAGERNGGNLSNPNNKPQIELQSMNGIDVGPVRPSPVFHGKQIPMSSGYVGISDIDLWDENERLDIHLGQFRQRNGRRPTPEEMLDIMLSKSTLPGVSKDDEFAILELARSIAINGVRKPPIIDQDRVLLDGNRRVSACYLILNSSEFTTEEKKRVEHLFVWQLTEHATEDDRNRVVVSLNFESDCKQDWPEYVKARKVHELWMSMLAVEPRTPAASRQGQMKKELSKRFALGPDARHVNRYLKMVDWALEFEEYHINDRAKNEFEVKHRTNEYFQYFDELSKGVRPGGVAHALGQDEPFKHLAYDLLYDGKFKNWKLIRDLKYIPENEEARETLYKARDESDMEVAQELVEHATLIANMKRPEIRRVGVNTRIETFVKWLEELPLSTFRDHIRPKNLMRLLDALTLVQNQAVSILQEEEPGQS